MNWEGYDSPDHLKGGQGREPDDLQRDAKATLICWLFLVGVFVACCVVRWVMQ